MKKSVLLFIIICFNASLAFALTNNTVDILKRTMPAADSFNKKTIDGTEYFEALKADNIIGYCMIAECKGYSGSIRFAVGVDLNGVIQNVDILENNETPGFGTRIDDSNFLGQFRGKSAGTVAIGKNIDAVTGATVSSKALTDAINNSLLHLHQLKLRQKQ